MHLGSRRMGYAVGLSAMLCSLALQAVILPRNRAMLRVVEEGRGKDDEGEEGSRRIGELWQLNFVRVVCSAVAFGVCLVEALN